jgi:DNA-directed RNA polymerase subunit RPC12/RpoP
MGKLVNTEDVVKTAMILASFGGVMDEKTRDNMVTAIRAIVEATPETKIDISSKSQKSGTWGIPKVRKTAIVVPCNECGESIVTTVHAKKYLFCPYCGSKNEDFMDASDSKKNRK